MKDSQFFQFLRDDSLTEGSVDYSKDEGGHNRRDE